MREKQSGFIGIIVLGLLGLLAIVVLIYLFVARPFKVSGRSMEPALMSQDYVVLNLGDYRFNQPQRGDVVIFEYPEMLGQDYIARIVGLPGEKIMIKGGEVMINGQILNEGYLGPEVVTKPGTFLGEGVEQQIPASSYAVMGDNRERSADSREHGFVPGNLLKGKYWFTYQKGN